MKTLIDQLLEILQESGGWGLSALLLFVVWKLWKHIQKQHKERIEEQKSTYELLFGVKSYLQYSEKSFDRFATKFDQFATRLEQVFIIGSKKNGG